MHAKFLASLSLLLAINSYANTACAQDNLPQPRNIIADKSLPAAQQQGMALAARRYYAFWNTGETQFAQAALADNFMDRNLPAGRPQGPQGALFASKNFRAAVPDLKLEVEEMLLVGDRVIGRLHFSGHFSGSFHGQQGDGRKVDFIATDIYRIADGRIAENWHLEDKLTLLQQLGIIKQ
ncbi:ester cyclase [Undibacterium sp. Ji83W]|uniref:ester cyclase n=1 Tax=Undibacterium sp. Ji83W TaxID=3413043 RepID=UPI003BEF56B4